jgi:cyclopropane fatty-acyl-phospholipid synthase-like methyltransferase
MSKEQGADLSKMDPRHYYDSFAESGWYDVDSAESGWPAAADELMARAFDAKPAESIGSALDLGAGTGLTVAAIKKHVTPERLVAVDLSSKMLELFKKKDISEGVELETDSIQHYVAECKDRFDLIIAFNAIQFLPNLPMTLRDTTRLLNPGGALALTYVPRRTEEDPPERLINSTPTIGSAVFEFRWLPGEIEQAVTDGGLEIVDRLPYATPDVRGLDYSLLIARNPET